MRFELESFFVHKFENACSNSRLINVEEFFFKKAKHVNAARVLIFTRTILSLCILCFGSILLNLKIVWNVLYFLKRFLNTVTLVCSELHFCIGGRCLLEYSIFSISQMCSCSLTLCDYAFAV